MGERLFELPPMPPAPLAKWCEKEVDPHALSRVVGGLYAWSDTLNFQSLSWQY